jgi:hypothetical protein
MRNCKQFYFGDLLLAPQIFSFIEFTIFIVQILEPQQRAGFPVFFLPTEEEAKGDLQVDALIYFHCDVRPSFSLKKHKSFLREEKKSSY